MSEEEENKIPPDVRKFLKHMEELHKQAQQQALEQNILMNAVRKVSDPRTMKQLREATDKEKENTMLKVYSTGLYNELAGSVFHLDPSNEGDINRLRALVDITCWWMNAYGEIILHRDEARRKGLK